MLPLRNWAGAMDVRFIKAVLGACLACAWALGGAATAGAGSAGAVPADGGAQAATVDVEEPGAAPVALKTDADGNAYWELEVKAVGLYIASWQRSSGIWESPEAAQAALVVLFRCRNATYMNYLSQFASYDAFSSAPGVRRKEDGGTSFTDPATVKARDNCLVEADINFEQLTSVEDASNEGKSVGRAVVQIPTALTGPGTHELFIAGYELLDGHAAACPKKSWAAGPDKRGGIVTLGCDPTLKDVKKFTLTVPRHVSPTVLRGPVVEPGSWFVPSHYSNVRAFGAPTASSLAVAGVPPGLWSTAGPALLLGVVLAGCLALPTALLATVGRNRQGLPSAAAGHIGPPSGGGSDAHSGRWRFCFLGRVHGLLAFLILILCSVLAAAGQRGFGWNQGSARLAASFLVAFLLVNYGAMAFRWSLARRRSRGFCPRLAARPVYVAVLLASLIANRAVGLEPALVFGAVLGVDYSFNTADAGLRRPALAAVAGSFHVAVLGLAAWGGYSFIAANRIETFIRWEEIQPDYVAAVGDAAGFAALAVGELLGVVAVVAIAVLPVILLPFAPLEGALIWRWSRGAWVLCYAVAAALFSFVLLPVPGAGDAKAAPFAAWVSLYAAYCLLGGGVWAVLATRRRRKDEKPAPKVGAGVEH
ncbi:hypothetical protein [Arthrobacter sp. H35-D1]|uniref:hypothetical protein n=1 Tax=Arthrobacter sp. H35-D1 TaxID=3046202 RepID=UPI0024B9AC1F|nr:hypothetical protein [Arthrobacter sp. H35-D1]MDJ0314696.1 hypothetical protein [Arthrobacter sp. H35-D1]